MSGKPEPLFYAPGWVISVYVYHDRIVESNCFAGSKSIPISAVASVSNPGFLVGKMTVTTKDGATHDFFTGNDRKEDFEEAVFRAINAKR